MNVLVVGRTLPTDNTGSYGLFEFQQAKALSRIVKTGYMFIETSSFLSNKKIKKFNNYYKGLPTFGYYLPAKGLPKKIYSEVRYRLFKSAIDQFIKKNWLPDIIHIHFPLLIMNSKIVDYLNDLSIKIVVTEHWSKTQKKGLNIQEKQLLNMVTNSASRIICVSDDLKLSIYDMTDVSSKKLVVIPNIVSNEFFLSTYNRDFIFDELVFTYVGRIEWSKRLDLLIQAFQKTFSEKDKVRLNIIGSGKLEKRIKKQIIPEFTEKIIFWGNLLPKRVNQILTKTDIYVSASESETFGVPFIEAMAKGIPVIAADNIPIRKYINDENGILFKVGSLEDLSNKLEYMFKNYKKFSSKKIKEKSEKNFSEYVIAKQLVRLYESI